MPGRKTPTRGTNQDHDVVAEKTRRVEASRAAARRYSASLKKPSKRPVSSADEGDQASSKKQKRQGRASNVPESPSPDVSKMAKRLASRRSAREYAKTLASDDKNADEPDTVPPSTPVASSDPGSTASSPLATRMPPSPAESPMAATYDAPPLPAPTSIKSDALDALSSAAANLPPPVSVPLLPPTPPMPDFFGVGSPYHSADTSSISVPLPARPVQPVQPARPVQPVQPARPVQPVHPPVPSYSTTGLVETRLRPSPRREARQQRPRRQSFLRHAIDTAAVNSPESVAPPHRLRPRRTLEPVSAEHKTPADEAHPPILEPSTRRSPRLHPAGKPARPSSLSGADQRRSCAPAVDSRKKYYSWSRTGLLSLVPLVISGVTWGVVVPAWPRVKPALTAVPSIVAAVPSRLASAAKTVLELVPGLGPDINHTEKCFLASGDNAMICKVGAELVECPAPATCGLGRILTCEIPFDIAEDGEGCALNAAAAEEAEVVVKALSELTIAEQCWGSGLVLSSRSRSCITLGEAARTQGREHLPLLASLPPGNVADLVDLEGTPGSPEFGSDRIAWLSHAALRSVKLPMGCRIRLWAVRKALDHWKVILGGLTLLLAIIRRDRTVRRQYQRHVQVCSMRNESYKALLDHAARDSTPMQVGHIQDFVADKRRGSGEGSTASAKKLVRDLWRYVESEVELDSRIRRSYKNVRGQNNVPCWEWLAPAASFETIGALDPGSAPHMWLLRN